MPSVSPGLLASRSVVLFPDTFSDYNDPRIAQAAARVLEAAGYAVILPETRVCCGRPLISKGRLDQLKPLMRRQLDALAPYVEAGLPIVGLEPSCILTFRDELPDMLDDPRAPALARQSFLFDEFLAREIRAGRAKLQFRSESLRTDASLGENAENAYHEGTKVRSSASEEMPSQVSSPKSQIPILLHGHCHQKALVGTQYALELLRMIPGASVREVDSGCCGMAGSFGYEAEHYPISLAMGERALLPAVRALAPEAVVVAMGASCRQQIADGAGRRARHLAEVLEDVLLM